jgi:hypothetical protein
MQSASSYRRGGIFAGIMEDVDVRFLAADDLLRAFFRRRMMVLSAGSGMAR